MSDEKLKPCPLCGSEAARDHRFVWCTSEGCGMVFSGLKPPAWQSLPRPSAEARAIAEEMRTRMNNLGCSTGEDARLRDWHSRLLAISDGGTGGEVYVGRERHNPSCWGFGKVFYTEADLLMWIDKRPTTRMGDKEAVHGHPAATPKVPAEVWVIITRHGEEVGNLHATRDSAKNERREHYPGCEITRREVVGADPQERPKVPAVAARLLEMINAVDGGIPHHQQTIHVDDLREVIGAEPQGEGELDRHKAEHHRRNAEAAIDRAEAAEKELERVRGILAKQGCPLCGGQALIDAANTPLQQLDKVLVDNARLRKERDVLKEAEKALIQLNSKRLAARVEAEAERDAAIKERDTARDYRNSWQDSCYQAREQRDAAIKAKEEALAANERDRSRVAEVISAIRAVIRSYGWATVSRGSYHYDDDEYMREFGRCLDAIEEAIAPLKAIAKDLTDCPTTQAEVMKVRQEDSPAPETKEGECDRCRDGMGWCPVCDSPEDDQEEGNDGEPESTST